MPTSYVIVTCLLLTCLICHVDEEVSDGLKEVVELLSGLSSFVKVDKLTKVMYGGHVGIDGVVCCLHVQTVDVWRSQATIEYENDDATTTIEVCVCVCVCLQYYRTVHQTIGVI